MSTGNFDFSGRGFYPRYFSDELLSNASHLGLNWSWSVHDDLSQSNLEDLELRRAIYFTWKFEWENLKKTSGIIGFKGLLTLSYQERRNDKKLVRKLMLMDWTGQQIVQQLSCVKDDSTVSFHISLTPIRAANLIDPFPSTKLTDAILVVGGVQMHVNKAFLSMHSEYFRVLFNSDFKEKSISEIPIEEVNPLAFTHLLKVLHMTVDFPKDVDLEVMLKLADRFIIPSVFHRVQHHLMTFSQLPFPKILNLADQYQMEKVIEQCMTLITTGSEFKKVKSSSFLKASIPMKLKLLDHAAKLAIQTSKSTEPTAIPQQAEPEENVLTMKYSHPVNSIEIEKLQSGSMSGLQWTWSLRNALTPNASREELSDYLYFSCEFEWEELRKTGVVGFDGFIDWKWDEPVRWKLQVTESRQKINLFVDERCFQSGMFVTFCFELTLTPIRSSDNTVMFSPSESADAILVVEGVRMHVNRDYLSVHSEYFRTLFNSDSDEFLIDGVSPKSFERLLAVIQPICEFPEDNSVEMLLTLAKRFKIPAVINQVQHHFLTTSKLPYWKMLKPADEFNMELAVAHCVQLIKNAKLFAKIHSSPFFAELSTPTKLKFLNNLDEFF